MADIKIEMHGADVTADVEAAVIVFV